MPDYTGSYKVEGVLTNNKKIYFYDLATGALLGNAVSGFHVPARIWCRSYRLVPVPYGKHESGVCCGRTSR
jgi:hypothetical protein